MYSRFKYLIRLIPFMTRASLITLILMVLYGILKQLLFPDLKAWHLEIAMIVISGIAASIGAYSALREVDTLHQKVMNELDERKRAEKELLESEGRLKQTLAKLRKAMWASIQAMASTVETRDSYTAGHQRRVTDLARAIATEMGLSEDTTDAIRMASAIHDIGKISIPIEILSNPRKLTKTEFELIKTHPETGYNILKDIEFPWPVAEIERQHHERIDGSGYPQGLKGGDILIEARILAVADVVEAMASDRPYRPAQGIEVALEEIERNKGILYDSNVVDACLNLFTVKGFGLEQ